MVDEASPVGLRGEDPGRSDPPAPDKLRSRVRKASDPKPTPLTMTKAGDLVGDQVRRKLTEMVDAAAMVEAHRRRATAIDSIDYERVSMRSPARPGAIA